MSHRGNHQSASSRWRALALLLMGLVGGTLLLGPASAHLGTPSHLWRNHIKPKVKALGDNRWVRNQGTMSLSVIGPWVEQDPAITGISPDLFNDFSGTKTGTVTFELFPELPTSLYGKRVRLTGLELCYNANNAAVTLSEVTLTAWATTAADGANGQSVVRDTTDRDESTCRSYAATPRILGTNGFAELELDVDWNGTGSFRIQRTTFFFRPTSTPAGPLSPVGPAVAAAEPDAA